MTRSELATWITRMGEKYPDRVGVFGHREIDGKTCILGQIGIESGLGINFHSMPVDGPYDWRLRLDVQVAELNNTGMRWGLIPLTLGLVPGETAATDEPAVDAPVAAEPELVEV